MSSVHLNLGLSRLLFQSSIPSSISVHRFLAVITWPKYWSLRRCTVVSRRSCGCTSCSTDALVRRAVQLTLSNRRYAVISTPCIRLLFTAFSVHVLHPYSASVHTNADRSRCLTLMSKYVLSFHTTM